MRQSFCVCFKTYLQKQYQNIWRLKEKVVALHRPIRIYPPWLGNTKARPRHTGAYFFIT